MHLFEVLKHKIKFAKRLISNGNYRDFFKLLLANAPFFMNKRKIDEIIIYSRLHREYRKFINEYKYVKLQTGGGESSGHENIIWWLWLQGVDEAPEICKACLSSLRRWHNDKKIITLDKNNLHEYITLPDYINEKHEQGIISNAQYSDIIRIQLLAEHGGTWADSTLLCTGRKTEYVMHLPLFAFKWKYFTYAASSWFIVSDPHDPIVTLTRDLLFDYWKNHDNLPHYFLFHMFFKMAAEKYKDEWEKVPTILNQPSFHMVLEIFEDYSEDRMKYFESISDYHKISYKSVLNRKPSERSLYQHIIDTYRN